METYECTISGKDGGGYVFQNVFHLTGTPGTDPVATVLNAICLDIQTNIIPEYADCMTSQATLFDVSARQISAPASFSYHLPINQGGTRAVPAAVGALAGCIKWLPVAGTVVGRIFAAGVAIADFVNDIIDPAYETLLNAWAAKFMLYNGTSIPYSLQLVSYNKDTEVATPMVAFDTLPIPTTLNKRQRG